MHEKAGRYHEVFLIGFRDEMGETNEMAVVV
jgi:hypothetical protein